MKSHYRLSNLNFKMKIYAKNKGNDVQNGPHGNLQEFPDDPTS
jgi:hypothetical protein